MTSFAYSAFVKVMIVILFLALWSHFFQPFATTIELMGQWALAQYVYPFFPYSLFQSVQQTALLVASFEWVMWIIAPGATKKEGNGSSDNASNSSFTTRSIYHD